MSRLESGRAKLVATAQQVVVMQNELQALQPVRARVRVGVRVRAKVRVWVRDLLVGMPGLGPNPDHNLKPNPNPKPNLI